VTKYWYFYEPARPKEVKNGIKARSKRGTIGETWWSKKWVKVLESFNLGARLTRGRSYARKGQVISIDVSKGLVRAKVQGTMSKPYDVKIHLKPLSDSDWEKVIDAMAAKAVFAARLLSGEMPQDIEEAFSDAGTSLFPESGDDLETECSCPDWSNPCKHIAAVYYLLAEQFDNDPFLIFKLRGRTKEEIIEALRVKRASGAAAGEEEAETVHNLSSEQFTDEIPPLEECLDTFWQAGEELKSIEVKPRGPDVENAVLKRLGDAPFNVGKVNLAALLSRAYEIAGSAALKKAAGDGEKTQSQSA
jgi:uncharacterized Zn finger protein